MTFTELPAENGARFTGDLYSISVNDTEVGCGTASEIRQMVEEGIFAADELQMDLIWSAKAA